MLNEGIQIEVKERIQVLESRLLSSVRVRGRIKVELGLGLS